MNTLNGNDSHKKGLILTVIFTAVILSVPLIAMQFSEEVDWKLLDFVLIGTLLIGAGTTYEFVVKRLPATSQQMIASVVLLVIVMLIWAELAVGVFGSPFAGS